MGWAAILVPEKFGGLEYGYTGIGIVLEETGRTLTPSPLLSTAMVCTAALVRGGTEAQCEAILPAVAAGDHLLALATDETSRPNSGPLTMVAKKTADGYCLNGKKIAVVDAHTADTLIISANSSSGVSLFLVPSSAEGVSIEPRRILDTHYTSTVTLNDVELGQDALLGDEDQGQALLDYVLDVARIGASAELFGIAQEAFERTLEYLKDRKQFGVAIGSFQALKHRAAFLYGEIEMCKSLLLKTLQSLDEGDGPHTEIASMCKAKMSEVAHLATTESIQMHGGIGMTDEFDIGFFLKRSQILETLYGDRNFHLDRYARARGY